MKKQQDGFVSIIVALVVMIFISLLALGFAFLARQNQSQNQNRLLSTQAFYAAESGVNDAVNYLKNTPAANRAVSVNTCGNNFVTPPNTIGSSNTEVKYTCLLYDTAPRSLEYTVGTEDSRTIRLESQDGPIRSVTISWQDSGNSTQFATNNDFWLPQSAVNTPANATNGNNLFAGTGVLRATLTPIYSPMTRNDLTTRTQTLFLYPRAGAANTPGTRPFLTTNSISDTNQGAFVNGNCNASAAQNLPRYCSVTITNANQFGGTSVAYLRLRSLYKASNVHISVIGNNNTPARLINEQAVIDSTGKATDVLRRIQVRVPLTSASKRPEFAVETIDNICKRLQVWPGGASVDAPAAGGGALAACDPYN